MKQSVMAAVYSAMMLSGCVGHFPRDRQSEVVFPASLSQPIEESLDLRRKYDIHIPTSTSIVYVATAAAHHTSYDGSTIAWRDTDGWRVSQMAQIGPGLVKVESRLVPETVRTLSAEDSANLDRLLGDRAIYAERPMFDRRVPPDIGGAGHTMETVTPRGRSVVTWWGRLEGRSGRVADLVIGR